MTSRCYYLDGHQPIPCTLMEWGERFNDATRIVAQEHIGDIFVSTVFLGLDHALFDDDGPLLFETMIFGGPHDEYQTRCATWNQALAMHDTALALVKETD